jgi:hypothetical protein
MKTPLYGHVSAETAYVVDDYPYGFRLRCKMRCWLESHDKKGARFVTQTTNPKKGDVWNKPKASTYMFGAGAMFLADDGRVGWEGLSEYSSAKKYRTFIETYGSHLDNMPRIAEWIRMKIHSCNMWARGELKMSINGVVQEPTEADLERYRTELAEWKDCLQVLHANIVIGGSPAK